LAPGDEEGELVGPGRGDHHPPVGPSVVGQLVDETASVTEIQNDGDVQVGLGILHAVEPEVKLGGVDKLAGV